ncbi:MAG: hypothetical protein QOK40_1157 [Miltoncostaeaceae bacterium]|nr:hypothetical protein [Miltoncostaeaceae bacterium]
MSTANRGWVWLGSAGGAPEVREGRRMRWLDTVLEPAADIDDDSRRPLQPALAVTLGIDALVVMKDVLPARRRRGPLHPALAGRRPFARRLGPDGAGATYVPR